jgi:hypothetical protein
LKSATYSFFGMVRSALYTKNSARRLKAKYPFFSESWYLARYPELTTAKETPIEHYFTLGWREGREPHYFFWSDWYKKNLPVTLTDDPLRYFLQTTGDRSLAPHPLFDASFYVSQVEADDRQGGKESRVSQGSPAELWLHYLRRGAVGGLSPHPLFSPRFYLSQVEGEVLAEDALRHYLEVGYIMNLSPSDMFDEAFYKAAYPDVAANNVPGLLHYQLYGQREGRYRSADDDYEKSVGRVAVEPHAGGTAVSFRIKDNSLGDTRLQRVTMLLPRLSARFLTGGPNTALAFIGLLAIALNQVKPVVVRVVATDDSELAAEDVALHLERLIGNELPANFEVQAVSGQALEVWGQGEAFVATTWSTMQALDDAGLITESHKPIYLIQDFEASFYPASTSSVLAKQTYQMPHRPVVNTRWLADFLHSERIGRFAEVNHHQHCLTFWPAINRELFDQTDVNEFQTSAPERVLVFYTRPFTAPRNLFPLGLAALRKAHADGLFDSAKWRFIAIGDLLPPTLIAPGVLLESTPWVSIDDYAKTIRSADVLLSLMASPHPSYPPLEAAVAGARVVTNTWVAKDASQLREVIPSVFPAEPSLPALTAALKLAIKDMLSNSHVKSSHALPTTWQDSFSSVIPKIVEELIA